VKRIRERVAGLDVHRDTVVACCQVKQPDRSIEVTKQSFATTANGLGQLAAWLSDTGVETVAMEATGVYWKPVHYCLEGLFDELWLCNAQHVKNVPGRKTDLSDAEWLADVAAHGMVRPSFVPPPEIRENWGAMPTGTLIPTTLASRLELICSGTPGSEAHNPILHGPSATFRVGTTTRCHIRPRCHTLTERREIERVI
jgi:hypothetical protein